MRKLLCDHPHALHFVPLSTFRSKFYRDGSYSLDWESGERKELRQPESRLKPFSSANCCIPNTPASDREGAGGQPPGPAAAAASAASPTLSELVSRDRALASEVLSSLGCVIPVEKILSVPRFLRIRASGHHGGADVRLPISTDDIRNELRAAGEAEHDVEKVDLTALEDFVALPYAVGVAHLPCHLGGRVVGQDLSSGVAVRALLHGRAATKGSSSSSSSRAPCHALELCCAPGGKLWYLAELLLQGNDPDAPDALPPGHRTVTGVDLSRQRLDQCRGGARRLGFRNVRLLEADARTFDEGPPAAEEFPGDVCRETNAGGGGGGGMLAHVSCLPARKQAALKARLCRSGRLPQGTKGGRDGPTSEEERAKQESRAAILDALSLCERLARASSLRPACGERGADSGTEEEDSAATRTSLGASGGHGRREASEWNGQRQDVCCASGVEGERRGYDLVMVDAECSADGSVPHLRYMMSCALGGQGGGAAARAEAAEQRYRVAISSEEARAHIKSGTGAFETPQLHGLVAGATVDCRETPGAHYDRPCDGDVSPGGLDDGGGSSGALRQLQGDLLRNGFRLLAPGGALVYVTCSSREEQNEGLVGAFLAQEPRAALEHVETFGVPAARRGPGGNMALLGPETSGTSGLFIARIAKAQ